MRHGDAKLSIRLSRAASYLPFPDIKDRGGFDEILKAIVTDDRYIDTITARQ
jgi:hypothetical protein